VSALRQEYVAPMNRFASDQRSTAVAWWLFAVAALVFAMVVVGGATRLTNSGLSITEWKPIVGVVPPLNHAQWTAEFAKYQQIPQYQQINHGMSLRDFQSIYWWEWTHRLLGRLIGVVFAVPLVFFLATRRLPRRLVWRCAVLLALGGLQGLIGWWMVSSGLSVRVDVAPERLTIHLGAALILFIFALWTGLEAWAGPERVRPPAGWVRASTGLLGLAFVQCLLGGLVAGNDAGLVYNDWPMMNGHVLPPVDWKIGPLRAFLHDQALVQFDHRLGAYALLLFTSLFAVQAVRARMPEGVRMGALALALLVWVQAGLGVAALMNAVPIWLGGLHQAVAVVVVGAATYGLWRMRRFEGHLFGAIGSRVW
jgi:cytochrome c oxidase assembly protein subunit 15